MEGSVKIAKHLTDKQKKKIVADYIECGNYSQVARAHKVSVDSVKRFVLGDKDIVKKTKQKKEQNVVEIIEYMECKKEMVCDFIDLYLNEMMNPKKIEKATVNQLSTAFGTVIDKFTINKKDGTFIEIEDLTTLKDMLK